MTAYEYINQYVNVKLKPSIIQGVGVFALRDILKDEELFNSVTARESRTEDEMVIKKGRSIINKEVVQVQKNGNKRYCLISKLPLKTENDEIIGMVGITNDISERKKAEMALLENGKRLI